jgi:hypothetical protein
LNQLLFKIFFAAGLLSIFLLPAYGQKKISKRDSIRQEKIRHGKMIFSQVVAPASAPETGFLLGSASAFTFSTHPKDTLVQRSVVPLIAYVSVRGSYGAQSSAVFYFKNKLRWLNSIEFNHIVDNYWGVGYEAGSTIEQGENTTRYTKNNFRWNPKVVKEIKPQLFIGLQADHNYSKVSEANPVMEQEANYIKYGDVVETSGLGVIAQYDSRDMIVNAWRGMLIEISYLNYPSSWATGNGYSIFSFDYRQFKSIGSRGRVLAWNIRSRFGFGDIPYTQLSTAGSGNDLRGYYDGRYRDQSSATAMIEYRHTFKKGDGLSKHGFVMWTGAGQILNYEDPFEWSHTLPVAGLGYRFAIQPRINIRVDAGFGKNSSAFYINITEAF